MDARTMRCGTKDQDELASTRRFQECRSPCSSERRRRPWVMLHRRLLRAVGPELSSRIIRRRRDVSLNDFASLQSGLRRSSEAICTA
jgi:hypothetical protein